VTNSNLTNSPNSSPKHQSFQAFSHGNTRRNKKFKKFADMDHSSTQAHSASNRVFNNPRKLAISLLLLYLLVIGGVLSF